MSRAEDLYYSPAVVERSKAFEANVRRKNLSKVPFGGNATNAHAFAQLAAATDMITTPLFGAWLDRIAQAVYSSPHPTSTKTNTYKQYPTA